MKVEELTILQTQKMFRSKIISIKELTAEYLYRISKYDQGAGKLNSVLEINPDALAIADNLDKHQKEERNPLYGIPVLLKDNIDTADRMHTSAGSLALADSFAACDADIVKALREKGAVILGKTNMTEFANFMSKGMKAGYSSRGGDVKSPYKRDTDASGSSTGSAVAVSSNFCTAALGTDTSGSIVSPAIKNGIVGFRPAIGTLSQKGLIPISFTLDTAGPMTRTVMDSALLFSELANTALDMDDTDKNNFIIGVNQTIMDHITAEARLMLNTVINKVEASGVKVKPVSLPEVPKESLQKIQLYEFKYSINKYLSELPGGYPIRSLKDIIDFNHKHPDKTLRYDQTLLLDAEENTKGDLSETIYRQLMQDRTIIRNKALAQLNQIDLCIVSQNDFVMQYTGFPMITVPCGLYKDGTPYGLCLTSINNGKLLKAACKIEETAGNRIPPCISA